MLNFLRKLRRNEMNRSKYLKYAVSEIFLVVIGILVALGINNLNTKRIKSQELSKYYQNHNQLNLRRKTKKRFSPCTLYKDGHGHSLKTLLSTIILREKMIMNFKLS